MKRLSVVIPVLDEAPNLAELLPSLVADNCEIVVVDGGSRDRSVEVARAVAGVRVIENATPRAVQMNRGAAAAGGEVLRSDIKHLETSTGGVILKTHGDDIEADKVVIAAGAWSHLLAEKLGANVPLETERGYHLELAGASKQPSVPVMDAARKFVATPMDGTLRLAGLLEFGGLVAPPSRAPTDSLLRGAKAMLPGLEFNSKRTWMGHRPAPADSLPVIGSAPASRQNFCQATYEKPRLGCRER